MKLVMDTDLNSLSKSGVHTNKNAYQYSVAPIYKTAMNILKQKLLNDTT